MTSNVLALPVLRQANGRPRSGLRNMVAALRERWVRARRLRETRRYVLGMDQHMLADIGVSRAQALFELDRASGRGG